MIMIPTKEQLEKENRQLRADCAVKDEALREAHSYLLMTAQAIKNREQIESALLTNPGAQLIEELERLQNLKIEVDNIEADGRPHGSGLKANPCGCDHCALWERIKIASTASDKPKAQI
jgi:hypothetical protein